MKVVSILITPLNMPMSHQVRLSPFLPLPSSSSSSLPLTLIDRLIVSINYQDIEKITTSLVSEAELAIAEELFGTTSDNTNN
jgi:hypothetical protein